MKKSVFKIIVVGDEKVGKTNIISRFCFNQFIDAYHTTIGMDFMLKTLEYKGNNVRLQIWDTAGQERFRTITQSYYQGAYGVIIVYDITDRKSFENLEIYNKQINLLENTVLIKFLVGNKTDLEDKRMVSYEEAEKYAKSLDFVYWEVCAKNSNNIEKIFTTLAKKIYSKLNGQELEKVEENLV